MRYHAKKNGDKWEVFTHGGRNNSGIDALEYAKKMEVVGQANYLLLLWIETEHRSVMTLT